MSSPEKMSNLSGTRGDEFERNKIANVVAVGECSDTGGDTQSGRRRVVSSGKTLLVDHSQASKTPRADERSWRKEKSWEPFY